MKYEIQIFAKDRAKVIRFCINGKEDLKHMPAEWEDFFYALGSVIDDQAEKIEEDGTLIGKLVVKNMDFDEVVEVMCEDLSQALTEILVNEKSVALVELVPAY